jgi:CRP-like cAMP-binding protein
MTSIDWSNQLGEFKILSCLNEEQLTHFLETSSEVAFNKGDVILQEGDIGKQSSLYFIGTGSVSIALSGVGKNKIPIDTLGPGEFFGEMAGLDKKPRTATVIAAGNCLLRKISGENFQSLMNQNAVFASRVATVLSERVRRLIENVLAVKLKDFDEKLALTNTKLDASLKSVESQQKAAHAVFEGINARANEVINSAERSRSRTTFVFSALGVAATILSLFLGTQISNVLKKADKLENLDKRIEKSISNVNTLENKLKIARDDMEKKFDESLHDLSRDKTQQLASFQGYLIRDALDPIVARASIKEVRSGRSELVGFYAKVLEMESSDITEHFFMRVEGLIKKEYLIKGKVPNKVIEMLKIGLEQGKTKTDRQKALSYYYLLAASLLEDDTDSYVEIWDDFEEVVRTLKQFSLRTEFDPNWFEEVMEIRGVENKQSRISKFNKAWRKLPRS